MVWWLGISPRSPCRTIARHGARYTSRSVRSLISLSPTFCPPAALPYARKCFASAATLPAGSAVPGPEPPSPCSPFTAATPRRDVRNGSSEKPS